ncbi:PSMD1 [Symbiodinium microadriaticum]|nr:PSMD1 [Symbiodinium microadriaticum]
MTVGIACVGTAFRDAIDLLQPVLNDPVYYMRQDSCMALAMVLMQITEARSPALKKFRVYLHKIINDKHQTIMSKSGAMPVVYWILMYISMFAYPQHEEKKEEKKERVNIAVLSTTAKTRAREAARRHGSWVDVYPTVVGEEYLYP